MTEWSEKRAELERQLLDAKQKVIAYEGTFKPYRTVTDSDYKQAKRDMASLATAIYNGDYEANKPADPLDGMSLAQLKNLYEQEKQNFTGYAGSAGQAAKLMKIQTRIQKLEQEAAK